MANRKARPKAGLGRAVLLMAVMAGGLGGAVGTPAAADMEDRRSGVLQALDKITARVSRLELAVGDRTAFGALRILLRACREAPPLDPPEAAAFLEIVEVKPDEGEVALFSGWMFASSPALSALEHAVYDISVIGCAG